MMTTAMLRGGTVISVGNVQDIIELLVIFLFD